MLLSNKTFWSEALIIWSRVPETALSTEATFPSVYIWEKGVPASRVKVDPPWLFIKLFNIQIPRYHSSFEFLSFIWWVWALLSLFCFCKVNLCFKSWNFENTWHSARRVVPGRRAKVFIWEKVVPPDRVTLPAETRQLTHPSCLAPRDNSGRII